MTDVLVENGQKLMEWFLAVAPTTRAEEIWSQGVLVGTAVRRDILTGDRQGKVILKGKVRSVQFESLGGGVYRAYLSCESEESDA